jgi:hypothetical protein
MKNRLLKNSRGQGTLEMILMMAVMVAVLSLVVAAFQRSELIASVISGPWRSIAGMSQNGVWGSPEATIAKHPNVLDRKATPVGEAL